jgi:hypothetical protein
MKPLLLTCLLVPLAAHADVLDPEMRDNDYHGPSSDDIELLSVKESAPVGTAAPFSAKIRNGSAYYLDRLSIACSVTDENGYRAFRKIVFRSAPIMSIDFDFPPITTPEIGVPPGAVTAIPLYTTDNRWTRGNGRYQYDCEVYGVSGRD